MVINLNKEDIIYIKQKYPNLDILDNKIKGEIVFKREYKDFFISDKYNLEIDLVPRKNSLLPKVSDLSSKVENIAYKYNKKLEDIHVNDDKTFCLVIDEKEKDYLKEGIFNWQDFFKNILEPYLFQMSFYNEYGYFPFGEYAHGFLGYLELYNEGGISYSRLLELDSNKIIEKNLNIKGHHPCLCGSNKKIRDCHKGILEAFYKFKKIYG